MYIYIYGNCASLADFKSHLRKCAKFILHPNNVTANKTDQLWQNLSQFYWPEESPTNPYNLRGWGEDMR